MEADEGQGQTLISIGKERRRLGRSSRETVRTKVGTDWNKRDEVSRIWTVEHLERESSQCVRACWRVVRKEDGSKRELDIHNGNWEDSGRTGQDGSREKKKKKKNGW